MFLFLLRLEFRGHLSHQSRCPSCLSRVTRFVRARASVSVLISGFRPELGEHPLERSLQRKCAMPQPEVEVVHLHPLNVAGCLSIPLVCPFDCQAQGAAGPLSVSVARVRPKLWRERAPPFEPRF